MQDRYAGDVGDYGKIGLLKCLQIHGFSIGFKKAICNDFATK